jgi:hypothetical protein
MALFLSDYNLMDQSRTGPWLTHTKSKDLESARPSDFSWYQSWLAADFSISFNQKYFLSFILHILIVGHNDNLVVSI